MISTPPCFTSFRLYCISECPFPSSRCFLHELYKRSGPHSDNMPAPHYRGGHRVGPPPDASQDDPDDSLLPASQPQPPGPPPTISNLERPKECINKYPTPAFSLLCTMMDRMRSEEASKRRETLLRFMSLWRVKVGHDMYPLIRLLLPDVRNARYRDANEAHNTCQRDRERPVYNLKEAMLAKCYIEVLGLDKHSEAAQRLTKWKQPVDGQVGPRTGHIKAVSRISTG